MKSPQFSIVIACYNSSSTIVETLESALAQTIRDFEIIVVDDGSTDDGPDKISKLAKTEPRLTLIRQSNAGVSASRNRGVRASRGEYVAFLDADDLWDPSYLATHKHRLDSDASLGVSFSVARYIDAKGEDTGQISRPKLIDLHPAEILATNPCTTCSAIVVRRSVIDEVGMFDVTLRRAEDQEWLFRVAISRWKIEGDCVPLIAYRNSVGGLSSNLSEMDQSYREMLDRAMRLRPALVERHRKLAGARMLRYLARRALRLQHGRALSRRYLLRALREGPEIVLKEPKQTVATLVAAFVPGCDLLFNSLRKA